MILLEFEIPLNHLLCYVDDTVFLIENMQDLQNMLNNDINTEVPNEHLYVEG